MSPTLLLALFSALAIGAFAAFAVLAYCDNTPRREDWKKFLSSFAGTALGLSVGFMSLMLQQQSQSTQSLANEEKEVLRKINEETAQIRAHLLYSIVQKKFELSLFLEAASMKDKTSEEMCDPATEQRLRQERFREVRKDTVQDQERWQEDKQFASQLFSNSVYERNSLLKMMKETKFPARIPSEMSSGFLERELELHVAGPLLAAQLLELPSIESVETLCRRLSKFQSDRSALIRTVIKLQLSTCGAFASIGNLTPADGIEKARVVHKLVDDFSPRSSAEVDKFLGSLAAGLGSVAADFRSCVASAEIPFDKVLFD